MSERIRVLLKALGVRQKEFAEAVGISQGFVSEIINGKNVPSHETLARISFKYRVNLNWLINGEGEMFIPQKEEIYRQADQDAAILRGLKQKKGLYELVQILLEINDEQLLKVKELIKVFLRK